MLVEHEIGQTYGLAAPRCVDVDGDGCAEVLIDSYVGNPTSHYVHVFDFGNARPAVFSDRFVDLITDPTDGAVWFVENSPFNEYGSSATMLAAA